MHDVVFLFDVDNTLIDNDRIQQDLREHLEESYGRAARERYWAIFDELWAKSATPTISVPSSATAQRSCTIRRFCAWRTGRSAIPSPSASTPARSTPSHMSGNGVCP